MTEPRTTCVDVAAGDLAETVRELHGKPRPHVERVDSGGRKLTVMAWHRADAGVRCRRVEVAPLPDGDFRVTAYYEEWRGERDAGPVLAE